MRKTSVYLDQKHARMLKQAAEAEGRPQAEILRDAIEFYVRESQRPRRFACAAIGEGPGDSVADIPEDILLRGFGE